MEAPQAAAPLIPAPAPLIPPSSGVAPTGPNGYVFLCRNATQVECLEKEVFGLGERELERMQGTINDGTHIFLLNMHSGALIGPFLPNGGPGLNLVPDAFDGSFNAQVKVTPPGGLPPKAVKINQKLIVGPKTAEEVNSILSMLTQGDPINPLEVDENDKNYGNQFPRGKAARAKGGGKGKWGWGWGWGYGKGKGMDALWMLAYGNKGWGKGDRKGGGSGGGKGETVAAPPMPQPGVEQVMQPGQS